MARRVNPLAIALVRTRAGQPDNDNGVRPHEAEPTLAASAIALADGRCAAVTLRLDPARHMRLRLACALGTRSAQAIMIEALDAFLKTVPGIDRLIADAMAEGGDQAATGWGLDQ